MISYYHFKLPFYSPFKTGSGDYLYREGVIIHYSDDKLEVLAEASPLPGFSKETTASVITDLISVKSELDSFFYTRFTLKQLRQFLQELNGTPSFQFAISDLGRKILQFRGIHPENHPLFQSDRKLVFVNDIVGYHDTETLKKRILLALENGFNTIKIKVPSPDPQLASVLQEIVPQKMNVTFRLDANQSWNFEKLKILNIHFKNLPIEYVEEPFSMVSDEIIADASSTSDFPIAVDESITDLNRLDKILKHHPNLFVIIKPMLLGNIFDISETLSKHRSSYNRVIITSSLEAAIGMESISILSALLGDRNRAHGLNTGKLFRDKLITDKAIENGFIEPAGNTDPLITFNQIDQSMLTLI